MTLTSFLDVKADPTKPDEAKKDLLKNSSPDSAEISTQHPPDFYRDPLQTVEYVELYNYRVAKRRRLCRALAWVLAIFLLLDVGVLLYIGLRVRHAAAAESDRAAATVTCRLRFRGSASGQQAVERTELITAGPKRILMQPLWASDGRPTVVHDIARGITLLRAPHAQGAASLCFIRHHAWRQDHWINTVVQWAKKAEHDVRPEQTHLVRLVARQPALSLKQLMSYGVLVWEMCKHSTTFLVVVEVMPLQSAECPMFKCLPCPSGVYKRDINGCQTCNCGSAEAAGNDEDDDEPSGKHRRRRAVVGGGGARRLRVDEGVLPGADGRAVHTIDIIEY